MGELSMTDFDAVLKDQMLGPIRKQFAEKIFFFKRLKRSSENVDGSGRKILMPTLLAIGQGVGARASGGALPTAQHGTYLEGSSTLKHTYGSIRINGDVIRASKKNAGAFARAATIEMQGCSLALKQDIERQFEGYGKGFMAQLNGAAAGQVLTLDNPGTKYLKKGMVIDVVNSAGTKSADSVTIASVDSEAGTITITGTISGCADNEYIVREDAYGVEMMGMQGIIDNDTLLASLQGIDSGDYVEWQGKVFGNGGTKRDLTLAKMQAVMSYMEEEMGLPSLIRCSFNLRDVYAALVVADKRHVDTMTLDGGFKAVEYNGCPLVPMPYCWPNEMQFIQESMLHIAEIGDLAWADEDGSILHKVSGYDQYEADLYYDGELGAYRRNCHARLTDLNETVPAT